MLRVPEHEASILVYTLGSLTDFYPYISRKWLKSASNCHRKPVEKRSPTRSTHRVLNEDYIQLLSTAVFNNEL